MDPSNAAYDRQIDDHLDQISIKIDRLGKQARQTNETLDRHNELLPQLTEQVSDTSQHTEGLTSKIKKIINGHAFQGGIKNSFHVVRKKENQNLNSTINQRRGSLLKESIREAFIPFSEMEHKNQLVRVIGGIKFIDDSSSVNVNAAWFSLEIHDAPIVWIMGGLDFRNNDYQIIFDLVKEKVKALVFLGKKPDKVDQIFGKIVPCIFHKESMKEAVEISYRLAIPGDTVLLSPACSSLDMFENFEDRGNQFRKYILALE